MTTKIEVRGSWCRGWGFFLVSFFSLGPNVKHQECGEGDSSPDLRLPLTARNMSLMYFVRFGIKLAHASPVR